jgi:acetyltransferase-like isoleucine patch superfamily enzyme
MHEDVFIHPTAVVDQPVEIGVGTKIWHFCHVMQKAKIGNHCVLGQNVFIGENVKIGNGVKIENNVSIFTGVTLEDDVFCGPSAVFTNVKTPRSAFPRNDAKRRSKTRVNHHLRRRHRPARLRRRGRGGHRRRRGFRPGGGQPRPAGRLALRVRRGDQV